MPGSGTVRDFLRSKHLRETNFPIRCSKSFFKFFWRVISLVPRIPAVGSGGFDNLDSLVVTGREKRRCGDHAGDQEQFGLHGRVCLSWFCERVLSLFTLLFAIGAAYLPDEFAIMS